MTGQKCANSLADVFEGASWHWPIPDVELVSAATMTTPAISSISEGGTFSFTPLGQASIVVPILLLNQ